MDKLNAYVKKHMFGFPNEAANINNPAKAVPLATLNRLFLFGAGLLFKARITQASTNAPAVTEGTQIAADEYDDTIEFTLTRTSQGLYKLAITGLPTTTDADKVHVNLTSIDSPLKFVSATYAASSLDIVFASIDGNDVFDAFMEVYYIN